MLRYSGVGVKAVDHIEHLCKFRCLFRQISCASSAEDHNINPVLPLLCILDAAHRNSLCEDLHICGVPAGKYCRKLHIIILSDSAFHAPAEISIA